MYIYNYYYYSFYIDTLPAIRRLSKRLNDKN